MSDKMDFKNKIKKDQRQKFSKIIEGVDETEIPQNILAMKDFITDDDNDYIRNDKGFFFAERLVDRLMYFSYLCGKNEVGNHARKELREFLNELEHFEIVRISESAINDVNNLVNSIVNSIEG